MAANLNDSELRFLSELVYSDMEEGLTIGENVQNHYDASGHGDGNADTAMRQMARLDNPATSGCGDYKVLDVCDMEGFPNGMYAMVVETDDHHAAIVFRGTNEGHEWVTEDLALLNRGAEETAEQRAAREYLESIMNDPKYDQYNFTIMGHSLGGELAMHAAITSGNQDRIDRVVSLDGPGFSQEYLDVHAAEIASLTDKGKMEHYQWSLVGDMLNQPDGVKNKYLEAADTYNQDWDVLGLGRHDLNSLKVDENGNFIEGEKDATAEVAGTISRIADWSNEGILNKILTVATLYLTIKYLLPTLVTVAIVAGACLLLVNGIKALWDAITKKQVSGTYETDLAALRKLSEDMETISSELYCVEKDANNIASSIQSKTADMWILVNHIKGILDDVHDEAQKFGFSANLFIDCAGDYHQLEGRVEGLYGQVKTVG